MSARKVKTAKTGTRLFGYFVAVTLSLISIPAMPLEVTATNVEALILNSETLRKQGFLRDAEEQLQQALAAQLSPDAKTRTLLSALLGNVYLQWRRSDQAQPLLEQSLTTAKQHAWPLLAAMAANYLGNLYFQRHQFDTAENHYQQSLNWADKAGDPAVIAQTRLNQARLASHRQLPVQAKDILTHLPPILDTISGSEQTDLSLQAAEQWLSLVSAHDADATRPAYQLLTRARQTARHDNDKRAQSLAIGYLARLYEYAQRYREALRLTDEAVALAQQDDTHDLLLQWEHQRARLLIALDRPEPAIAAYRRAIAHIEAIRQDIPVFYQHGRSSFRETLEPVYLGLADLLLQKTKTGEQTNNQLLLREVRQTVELIKKTELEDYFHGRCALPEIGSGTMETHPPRAATLYPIVLADRLELLVGIGPTIYQQSVKLPASTLIEDAKLLATQLRRRRSRFHEPSRRLYQALIAPLLPLLEDYNVETLIIIADRELRLIPFAALYDGRQYLIERYRLVYSPGLVLPQASNPTRDPIQALLAGISRPGPAIKTLPQVQLQSLLPYVLTLTGRSPTDAPANERTALLRSLTPNDDAPMSTADIEALLNQPAILAKAQQLLTLPGVGQEIDRLNQLLPATTLLDEGFMSERLQQEIRRTPYNIVHIASHGYFGHSSEQSYIMAYDRILTMDRLEQLLNQTSNNRSPIDLLTLSACQTAEGDDRSPLGLSGIALKARVRSVLGSLWPVSDVATVQLMQAFYRHLSTAPANKALALQKAQLELLAQPKRAHPFYWSPFILIGDSAGSGLPDG